MSMRSAPSRSVEWTRHLHMTSGHGHGMRLSRVMTRHSAAKTTITIARSTKEALWVEEPINQTKPFCKESKNEIRKFSIEDSPAWKKVPSGKWLKIGVAHSPGHMKVSFQAATSI